MAVPGDDGAEGCAEWICIDAIAKSPDKSRTRSCVPCTPAIMMPFLSVSEANYFSNQGPWLRPVLSHLNRFPVPKKSLFGGIKLHTKGVKVHAW
jgi:hypothetical protein